MNKFLKGMLALGLSATALVGCSSGGDDAQSDENQIAAKYPEMTAFAEKLAILKIPMILDRSKDEKDVLAKYEWSKVYGALFGCEKEASKLYEAAVSGHSGDNSESSDTSESTDTTENTDTEQ